MESDGSGVALVTGAGGGVGGRTAEVLDRAGWRVALLGRTAASLERTARGLRNPHVVLAADVADRDAVEARVRETERRLGPPTALVNAAGVSAAAPLLPPDDEIFDRTIGTNLRGAWVVTTACLPGMLRAGHGVVVNVASTAALRGYRHVAAYVASKHGLLGLTRAWALDLEKKGVRVHAICPGFLDTEMTAVSVAAIVARTSLSLEDARAALARQNASGRLIAPEAVAARVLALLDPATGTGRVETLE